MKARLLLNLWSLVLTIAYFLSYFVSLIWLVSGIKTQTNTLNTGLTENAAEISQSLCTLKKLKHKHMSFCKWHIILSRWLVNFIFLNIFLKIVVAIVKLSGIQHLFTFHLTIQSYITPGFCQYLMQSGCYLTHTT